MTKEEYIQQEFPKLLKSFGASLLLIGSVAILILSILDYFVTPENFKTFLFIE